MQKTDISNKEKEELKRQIFLNYDYESVRDTSLSDLKNSIDDNYIYNKSQWDYFCKFKKEMSNNNSNNGFKKLNNLRT